MLCLSGLQAESLYSVADWGCMSACCIAGSLAQAMDGRIMRRGTYY